MTKLMSRFLFTFILLVKLNTIFAQGEANWWYFGINAGLHFTPAPASVSGGMVNTTEGVASISDAAGNLLFYTDGVTVYNSLHAVMTNGSGLFGDGSSTQSAIIVQQPGSTSLYYIFTVALPGAAAGYSYSIVDMSMSGGLGAVTAVKNVLIYSPSTEKICAIRHCNNVDVWIVTHFYGSDEYRSFLLTSAGLNTTSVSSNAGTAITGNTQAIGYLHASYIGDKLCCVMRYTAAGSPASDVELLDFNNSTGVVSNGQNLGGGYSHGYGCEFSVDGRFLYTNCDYKVYQYDLCAGNIGQIVASQTQVGTSATMWIGSLQTGPDGKIYMAGFSATTLGVINNPTVGGMGCNYVDNQVPLLNTSNAGLPSFVNYYQPPVPPVITALMSCSVGDFSYPTPCSGSGTVAQSATWDFGDAASGAANTSTLQAPSHTFSGIGTYTVQLILDYGCVIDTVSTTVNVTTAMTVTVNSPSICVGQTATLTAIGGATSYTWSAGATVTGINTADVSPVVTTSYTVTVTSGTCTGTALATVTVGASLSINVTNDSICPGQTATLTANGGTSYTWSAGATATGVNTADASPATTTTYTVTGTSAGCSGTAIATVTVNSVPIILVNSPSSCPGVINTLTATGGTNYTWSAGATSTGVNTAEVSPVTTTTYTVTGTTGGCSATAVSTVTIGGSLTVTVTNDSICSGQTATLTASGGTSYTWSAGATTTGINMADASPVTTTTYTVTGTSAGCSGTAVGTVFVNSLPTITVNSPSICAGDVATLTASGATTYTWSAGATAIGLNTAGASPANTTTYTVTGSNIGCSATAISTVTVNPIPVITVNSPTICGGTTATLTANGGATYSWSAGATSTGINTAGVNPANTTTYTVTGTTLGCSGTAVSTVTMGANIILTTIGDTICSGNVATITVSGATNYVWTPTAIVSGADTATVSPNVTTTYTVTGSSGGCSGTATATVTVYATPVASFTAPLTSSEFEPQINFINHSIDATNYNWNFGDYSNSTTNTSTLENPTHNYSQPGDYCIMLIASNNNCVDTSQQCIAIIPEFTFYFPNSFTPDEDGINDEFCGEGRNILSYEMFIYNRWGELVFYSDDINKRWNGALKGSGEVVQQDVYVCVFDITDIGKNKHNYIGNVTLVK